MIVFKFLFSFLFFLLTWSAQAEVLVSSSVDRNEMRPGDTLTLSVTVESQGNVDVGTPNWPDLSAFQAVNSWTGNEIQSVFENGRFLTKRRQIFHLQLQALKEGDFTIGAVRINVDGDILTTKPITVRVSQNAAQAPPAEEEQSDPLGMGSIDDVFNQMLQDRLRRFRGAPGAGAPSRIDPSVNTDEAVFITSTIDKKNVYEGQQLSVTFYLYTRAQISDIDTLKYPTLAGFWKEDIEVATRLNFQPEIINGIQYSRALLASYALFPLKAGRSQIDPYTARLTLMNFNPFGNSRTRVVEKSSKAISINVMPLPAEGRPENFSGAVGEFQLRTSVDIRNPKVNQPVTATLRFEGKGNPKVIEIPKLSLPDGVEVYDVQNEAKFYPNGTGYKEFKILLIPRKPGSYQVDPLTVGFFDPDKADYYTLSSETFSLEVTGEMPATSESPKLKALSSTLEKQSKEPELPGLIPRFEGQSTISPNVKATVWGALYAVSLLVLLVLAKVELGTKQKREKLRSLVQKRISRIEALYSKGQWREAASEATNTIYFTLGELSGIGGGGEELEKMLLKAPPSFRNQNKEKIERLMKVFESLAFAPEEMVTSLREKKNFESHLAEVKHILLTATHLDFTDAA